ncbi:MAG: NAD(P)/FAD-dependent oxidoreductase [Candidatus Micrarchaeota archaeon]
MYDLHVVGAGPAGLFAAYTALKNGYTPIVSEEHATAGSPVHCSGLVSSSGLEQLSDVVDYKKITLNTINKATLHGSKNSFCLEYKLPKAYLISRDGFDLAAAQKYICEGGQIKFSHKVQGATDLLSKNVIGADGPISTTARIFNFEKISKYSACWQGEFAYKSEDSHCVDVFFDPEIVPGFIGWIIPINEERAKIGLGVSSDSTLQEAKRKFLQMQGVASPVQTSGIGPAPKNEFGALIPISTRPKTAKVHNGYNVCLCGDSAGQVKASSGGGIFFGAQCGRLAAQNFENPLRYESEWRRKYGLDLALHSHLRYGFDALTPDGIDLWMGSIKLLRLDKLLMQAGEMDEYSKMLSPKTLSAWLQAFSR